jgi:DNA polymerase III gamma/tau subunit
MNAETQTAAETRGTVQYDASQVVVFSGQARRMLADATDVTIDSPELYEAAAQDLQRVKSLATQVETARVSITGPLHQAKVAVDNLFKGPKDFLTQAEQKLKNAMLAWDNEQERIRREEQRRAEEIRRQEQARLDAERRQREEEARKREEEARRLEEEARAAAEAGDASKAEQLQLQAVEEANAASDAAADAHAIATTAEVITMPLSVPEKQKVSGISTSKTVDFEVASLHELVKHVAAHPELISLLQADSVKLRAYVRGLGMNCQLPGVRVFEKKTLSARAA